MHEPTLESLMNQFDIALDLLNSSTSEMYLVGGSVRDHLLGRPISDIDMVTPNDVFKVADELKAIEEFEIINTYKNYLVVLCQYKGVKIELTQCRREKYHPASRNPEVESCSLKQDAYRRDFTINALLMNKKGKIIDFVNGLEDLENKILRTPMDANSIFFDDPLRILRAIRFSQKLKFGICRETWNGCMTHSRKIKQIIAVERVKAELDQILLYADEEGLKLLDAIKFWDDFFPELTDCKDLKGYHNFNEFEHMLKVCSLVGQGLLHEISTSDLLNLKYASLLHDIGKFKCARIENEVLTYSNHEEEGAKIFDRIWRRLKFSNSEYETIRLLIKYHGYKPTITNLSEEETRYNQITQIYPWSDTMIRRMFNLLGNKIYLLINLIESDIMSKRKVARPYRPYLTTAQKIKDLTEIPMKSPLNGNELMEKYGISGKEIGLIKDYLLERVLSGELDSSNKDQAYKVVETVYGLQGKTNEVTTGQPA